MTTLAIAVAAAAVVLGACKKKQSKEERAAICEGARLQVADAWEAYADRTHKEVSPLKRRASELGKLLRRSMPKLTGKHANSEAAHKLRLNLARMKDDNDTVTKYKRAGLAAVPAMRKHAAAWQKSVAAGIKSVNADQKVPAFESAKHLYRSTRRRPGYEYPHNSVRKTLATHAQAACR